MKKAFQHSVSLMAITFSIFLMACGNNTVSEATNTDTTSSMAVTDSVVAYDISLVQNKKDPTCGMPVTAGISDTAHYDNKVLGFCSPGCKEEFLKNPKANIAAAEMQ
ncbi:MAG: hypothetical protein RL188_162 [Bacteroidota bacterium]|jgi:YHS domain-containing protein